ncbi:MAG TPA: ABC transporter permease [Bacteroidia bacterium]|nr:ABC transporter permease [Bacteroidia bacterium]
MFSYILKKTAYAFLVLFGVVSVIFLLFNVIPGDPAGVILGQRASKEAIDAIHRDLGTDKPLSEQYLNYLNDLSPLSVHSLKSEQRFWYLDPSKYSWTPLFTFGSHAFVFKFPYLRKSYISKREISEIIGDTLPETAVLALTAVVFSALLGIFLGVISAMRKDSFFDRSVFILSTFIGMSAPSFFVGLLLAWLFGYVLGDFTGLSPSGSFYELDVWEGKSVQLRNLVLPAITLGLRPLSIIIQLTRTSLLEVMTQDYIRTARAKGLSERLVIFRHALKNAMNPVVTAISGWLAGLLAGAVFVEKIFNWKGIGYAVVEALNNNDLPLVMGATLVFALIFVVMNIVVDIIYGILDPRVRIH